MSANNKRLIIILGLLIVLWVVISRIHDPRERRITYFKVEIGNLNTIELQSKNDTLRVSREGQSWVMEQPFYFPADMARVSSFLEQVLPVTTSTTPVSVSEDSHKEYSVTEDSGTLVSFYDINNNLLDRAWVGRRDRRVFARRPGENEVYLLLDQISFLVTANVAPWRQVNIVSLPASRISKIDVQYELNTYSIIATDSLWHYSDSDNSFSIRDTNTALRRIFENLEAIPSMRFIDNKYDEYQHLLTNPQVVITITATDNTVTTLEWGYDGEEGDFVVMKNGNKDHLFWVDANIADNFTKAYQHFEQ